MKKLSLSIFLLSVFALMAFKSDKPAYRLYNQKGKAVKFQKLVKAASEADVVLFGELHNNPIAHWLQLELTKALFEEKGEALVLGAEMYEADNQLIVDEYTQKLISANNFKSQARLWPNNATDYQPLLDFARENNLKFVAANIPRRYASIVFRQGFEGLEALPDGAAAFMAPNPIPYDPELPSYKSMAGMMGHSNPNLPKAQAVKDAAMAYFILENLDEGQLMLHFNGTFHSDDFEGIVWYLNQYRPGLEILTISSQEIADPLVSDSLDLQKANYILAIPEDMTKTH